MLIAALFWGWWLFNSVVHCSLMVLICVGLILVCFGCLIDLFTWVCAFLFAGFIVVGLVWFGFLVYVCTGLLCCFSLTLISSYVCFVDLVCFRLCLVLFYLVWIRLFCSCALVVCSSIRLRWSGFVWWCLLFCWLVDVGFGLLLPFCMFDIPVVWVLV